jgi:hypothetical protein
MKVSSVELNDWRRISVKQFWPDSCIGAATEWALCYNQVAGISYKAAKHPLSGTFEDLGIVQFEYIQKVRAGEFKGSFGEAAGYVRDRFGNSVKAESLSFKKTDDDAERKIRTIEQALQDQKVAIISIAQPPEETNWGFTTWHMYPVVGIVEPDTMLLYDVARSSDEQPTEMSIEQIISKHVKFKGGDDLLIIEKI